MDVDKEPKWPVIVVIFIVIGMVSAALGFAAEGASPRLSEVRYYLYGHWRCQYPKTPAYQLGLTALVTLLVFRCYCPGTRNQSSKARLCLISSWVAWLAALSFYVAGLVMVGRQQEEIRYDRFNESYLVCPVVKRGIFAAGAFFVLVSIVLEIIYLVIRSD